MNLNIWENFQANPLITALPDFVEETIATAAGEIWQQVEGWGPTPTSTISYTTGAWTITVKWVGFANFQEFIASIHEQDWYDAIKAMALNMMQTGTFRCSFDWVYNDDIFVEFVLTQK